MLGTLSEKYESNGDIACISTGENDLGGRSYGKWQLATNVGAVDSFLRWLGENGHGEAFGIYKMLSQFLPGSDEFSEAWKQIAEEMPELFEQVQHDYIQFAYYEPAVNALAEADWHIENHHEVMEDVVWSRAVQYGAGQIVEMFQQACVQLGYPNLSYVDSKYFDEQMIKEIYLKVCHTPEWTNGSPGVREGLYARFESECADALERLTA